MQKLLVIPIRTKVRDYTWNLRVCSSQKYVWATFLPFQSPQMEAGRADGEAYLWGWYVSSLTDITFLKACKFICFPTKPPDK